MQTRTASAASTHELLDERNALAAWPNGRALGWNRTSDTRFRKPVLYPLSYEGKLLRNPWYVYLSGLFG